MTKLTPSEAIAALKAHDPKKWTDRSIAEAAGYSIPGINRLSRGKRSDPPYSAGLRIVELAERELPEYQH